MTKRFATTLLGGTATALLLMAVPRPGIAQDRNMQAVARGARLYNTTCTRCHNARPATERSDPEWRLIVSHMRARANLPASRARAILAFLRATNGRDGARMSLAAEPAPVYAFGWQLLPAEISEHVTRSEGDGTDAPGPGGEGEG